MYVSLETMCLCVNSKAFDRFNQVGSCYLIKLYNFKNIVDEFI